MLDFEAVSVRFGTQYAVRELSLQVREGELLTLLGPSGCGKSTLIRVAAGFLTPDSGPLHFSGRLRIAGQDMTDLPPEQRPTATVFQNHALFPHLSVEDNVAYGLKARGVAQTERRAQAERMLTRVGLEACGKRAVQALSGGQQQRVALARALILNPAVLLLDEPLSSLDAALRVQMRQEIRSLQQEFGLTALYVTHDQEEALSISDRVAVMKDGRLVQLDTPEGVFMNPCDSFTAGFVSNANCLHAPGQGEHFVRPGTIRLVASDSNQLSAGDGDVLPGIVRERQFKGAVTTYLVEVDPHLPDRQNRRTVRVDVGDPDPCPFAPGAAVRVCLPSAAAV